MLNRVKIGEIKDIKNRLELELKDKCPPLPERKKEIKSLIHHLSVWLDWRDYQERKHYREVIQSES